MLAWLPDLLKSCGLLLLPVIAWNVALARRLPPALQPEVFDRVAPTSLKAVEHFSRLAVFLLPFAMPLDPVDPVDPVARGGLALWAAGTAIYFAAWLALIAAPGSAWARSRFGMLAPACTPALWLAGIALAGTRLFGVEGWRGWMYLVPVAIFLAAHLAHAERAFRQFRSEQGDR